MLGRMRVLILGAGFAGATSPGCSAAGAGATICQPENYMLYTPLLPEAASGTVEPRHVVVPLRVMCPHAELLLGPRRGARQERADRARCAAEGDALRRAATSSSWSRSARSRARCRSPASSSTRVGFKTIADAIHLRNHVLQQLELGPTIDDPGDAERAAHVRLRRRRLRRRRGDGRARRTSSATRCATTRTLRDVPQRWVLVDAADQHPARDPADGSASTRRSSSSGAASRSASDTPARVAVDATASCSPTASAYRRAHARLDGRRAGPTR